MSFICAAGSGAYKNSALLRAAQRHLRKLSFTRRAAALTKKSKMGSTKIELYSAPRSGAYKKNELCVAQRRSRTWKRPSCNQRSARPRTAQETGQLQMQSVRFHNKGTAQMPLSALRTRAAGIRWLRARTARDCTWCKMTVFKNA